ncbi:MAG TPA: GAF domain-containing protein [Anaerolineales bacterium]
MIEATKSTQKIGETSVRFPAPVARLDRVILGVVAAYVLVATAVLVLSLILARNRLADQFFYVVLPAVASLICLSVAMWVIASRRDRAGRAVAVLSISLAIVLAGLFDALSTLRLTPLWIFGLGLSGAAFLDLAIVFPKESPRLSRSAFLGWAIYLAAIGVAAFSVPAWIDGVQQVASSAGGSLPFIWLAGAALVYFIVVSYHGLMAKSAIVRAQSRLIAAATLVAAAPLLVWLLLRGPAGSSFAPYLALTLVVVPGTLAYTLLRFTVAGTDRWMRRGVVYLLLSLVILGAYALLVTGLSLVLRTAMPEANPIWIAILAFLLAVVLQPLRTRLQGLTDRTLFRGPRAVDETLQVFTDHLSGAPNLDAISRIVRQAAMTAVDPTALHIFVRDPVNDLFSALRDETNRPSTDLHFAARGPLAQYVARQHSSLDLADRMLPPDLQPEYNRLTILDARLIIPLEGREGLAGLMVLGPRRSGGLYSPADINVLEQLAEHAAMAIGRIQTVENLERRVQEMDALTRVAQGVNITLTFDDVLELIYTQTAQIVPLSHFQITLLSREQDYYYLAFALENNERLSARENIPLPAASGLAREVVRRGRAIITGDYLRECQAAGVAPAAQGITAWMAVPLNAGAESIGAISVGSRDPGATYTPAQLSILQAIADQTAGAIVKARLLGETQKRAAQLAKLNDVTRQLAATRDPQMLRQSVVEGAMSILDCAAGAFYAVAPSTTDLTVAAVAGPLAAELVGQIMPPGVGNAARAAASRGPAVDNALQPGSEAYFLEHGPAGFAPHTSLAVPLMLQDSISGVLEVMDRRDGSPFVPEDQTLAMAFAGQAAVALENVRLYTLTDQELADRVEELSVMQRIDRELNASLEMERAMRITLEWALRQSNAEAGFIGLLDEGRLHIITEMGYGSALGEAADRTLELTLPGFQSAIESGVPQRERFEAATAAGFLPSADHQVVIPIRREATVIGLLVLESTGPASEDLGFLGRLSDHAAIAISNAQLYDEVQRANIAKSEFVSLVAHELKNPMTSIKGYTELLATGAVGAVNDMQAGFLSTIRSNTERMSTLVSDLNDNSKIEAGRLRLDFKAVDLAELIDEIIRSTRRQIDDKKQLVQLELPTGLPQVWSDRIRLGQVLTNLISNANKYTPEGGTLTIGAEITPNLWDPEGARRVIRIWVRDTGIGISPEDQQRIFQKFFRSEDPKAREVPGAGLGLNITRSLVEMQGGRIWFESEYRQGTTFNFTVPIAEVEA